MKFLTLMPFREFLGISRISEVLSTQRYQLRHPNPDMLRHENTYQHHRRYDLDRQNGQPGEKDDERDNA
jgi:hypothetical protein